MSRSDAFAVASESVACVDKARLRCLLVKEVHKAGVTVFYVNAKKGLSTQWPSPLYTYAHAQSELQWTEKSPALPLVHLLGMYVDHFWPHTELSHIRLSSSVLMGIWCSSAAWHTLMPTSMTAFVAANMFKSCQF